MLCWSLAWLQGKEFIADNKEAQSTTLAANVASVNEELRGIIGSLHAGEQPPAVAMPAATCVLSAGLLHLR
jgi:hypothetical protein